MSNVNDIFIDFLNLIVGPEENKMITQTDLLKQVNCTAVSLSRYLSKQREIPVKTLFEIKKALNIPDNVFMKFYDKYSTNKNDEELFLDLYSKYIKLSDESKIKLCDYIEYLIFQQENSDIKTRKR